MLAVERLGDSSAARLRHVIPSRITGLGVRSASLRKMVFTAFRLTFGQANELRGVVEVVRLAP